MFYLNAIENTNIYQVFYSIYDAIKSTHDHIQDFFNTLQDYLNNLSNITYSIGNVIKSFLDPANTNSNIFVIAISGFIIIGVVFVTVDLVRDLL